MSKKKEKQNDNSVGLKFDRSSLDHMYSTSQNLRNEMDKKIIEAKEKLGASISKEQFKSIEFDNGWPLIVKEIVLHLTGIELQSAVIHEGDELPNNPYFEDSELNSWRPPGGTMLTGRQYAFFLNTFRLFMAAKETFRIEEPRQADEIKDHILGNSTYYNEP